MSKSNYLVTTAGSLYRMSKGEIWAHILKYFKICAQKFNIELPDDATLAVAYKIIDEAGYTISLIDRSDDGLWLIIDAMMEDNCPPEYFHVVIRIYDDDCNNITGKVLDEILS